LNLQSHNNLLISPFRPVVPSGQAVTSLPSDNPNNQGEFEYVYYYEYEYEDDDKSGAPKNTLPASILGEQKKPEILQQITTTSTTLAPTTSQVLSTIPPLLTQPTTQRSPQTTQKSLQIVPLNPNSRFPHFSSFPLLTDSPDGIVKPDIPTLKPENLGPIIQVNEEPRSQATFPIISENSPQFVEEIPSSQFVQPLTIPEVTTTTTTVLPIQESSSEEINRPSFLPTIPTQRPQASPDIFELNQFEVDQDAIQLQAFPKDPVELPATTSTTTTLEPVPSPTTSSPILQSSSAAPVPEPPTDNLVGPTASFDAFSQPKRPEPSNFVRFEEPDFLTQRPVQAPFTLTASTQQPFGVQPDFRGQPATNANQQPASFFNFNQRPPQQQPQQPQLPASTFSSGQFNQFQQFSSQPNRPSQPAQFNGRFQQPNQFSNFQQQQQQPQANRFPSQPFTAFNSGNPPAR